jgi:membrane associated rhomboid family serine protease
MNELSRILQRWKDFIWRSPEPITRSIIAIWLGSFLLYFFLFLFFKFQIPGDWIGFQTANALLHPWSFFLYPLFFLDFFGLLFGSLWLWWVGGTLERSWGRKRFTRFFIAMIILPSISLFIGSVLLKSLGISFLGSFDTQLFGLWTPIAGLTVAWSLLNPEQIIRIYFVIPVKAKYLMWAAIFFAYISMAVGPLPSPWLAFFGLSGIAYAYQHAKPQASLSYSTSDGQYKSGAPNRIDKMLDWLGYFWRKIKRTIMRR